MDAASLTCPQCGAAVSRDAAQCQYCQALLETVACSKCMAMMFKGSKFCPSCGASAVAVAIGENAHQKCPHCHTPLIDVNAAGAPLEECAHCGGLWVAVKTFDALCASAEAQTAALGLQLPPPVPADTHVQYLPCPQCGNLMSRLNYAGSGVVMKVCRAHGIWLDRDEIRRIIEFIRAGGLNRARQIEMDRLQYERSALDRDRIAAASSSSGFSGISYTGSIGHADNTALAIDFIGGLASAIGHFIK